jgi:hypothetical protein
MAWDVEFTYEFEGWWDGLNEDEQGSVARGVRLLEECGPTLPFPYSSGIEGSNFNHMRELRIQHQGHPYRVLYAFDPRTVALMLIGGDKTGQDRWYEKYVPLADQLYKEHLEALKLEKNDG